MEPHKQELFVERLLFLHRVATQRSTTASQNVRLSGQQFEKEVDAACLAGHVLLKMKQEVNPTKCNARVFSDAVILTCHQRFVEGILGLLFGN